MTIHDIPDECLRRGAQRQGVNMTKLTERQLIERGALRVVLDKGQTYTM